MFLYIVNVRSTSTDVIGAYLNADNSFILYLSFDTLEEPLKFLQIPFITAKLSFLLKPQLYIFIHI